MSSLVSEGYGQPQFIVSQGFGKYSPPITVNTASVYIVDTASEFLGGLDLLKSGEAVYSDSLAANATVDGFILTKAEGTRGYLLTVNFMFDQVQSNLVGIRILATYTLDGTTYLIPVEAAMLPGIIVSSRLQIEFRDTNIHLVKFSFQNTDTEHKCRLLNVKAKAYY